MSDTTQPAKPTHVTVTVDGLATTVPVGTNLVEAAKTVGKEIPYYCYHKGLSIAANCRMCMVEVSNAPPGKLVPGCQVSVVEGQKIITESPRVKEQQRAVLEFLLLNHPVDCSICDQAGECKLQDYYMEFDHRPSRLDDAKWMKNKRKVLGPLVVLDQERCIMCTRCVRFMDEVAKEPVLGMFGRGSREVIDVFPGKELTSNYAGNTVDICPVGALLNRDFRFRARSYFLSATPSVCTGCSRGCNTYLDHFQYVPYRYRPRENLDVNKYWMCDSGRLTYHGLYDDRVRVSGSGRGDARREVSAPELARTAASALEAAAGKGGLAAVISPVLSLEDALAALVFVKEGLKLETVYVSGRANAPGDAILLKDDRNPNRKGLELAASALSVKLAAFADLGAAIDGGKVKAAVVFGSDVPDEKVAEKLGKLDTVVAFAAGEGAISKVATLVGAASTVAEDDGTFVNFEGRAQRFVRAYAAQWASRPTWAWAGMLGKELGLPYRWASAQEVFADLGRRLAPGALGDFDWVKSAPQTAVKGVTPLTGGTVDGRPPGWRELVPLKTGSPVTGGTYHGGGH